MPYTIKERKILVNGVPVADMAAEKKSAEIIKEIEDVKATIPSDYSTLSSAVAQHENDIDALNNRIDTVTSLPEGSTSGDAELIDIRNGADGEVYNSAGTAVREQFKKQSSQIANFTERLNQIEQDGITEDVVKEAIDNYFSSHDTVLDLGYYNNKLHVFMNGLPVGNGIEIQGGSTPDVPTSNDNITLSNGVMSIIELANEPTLENGVLYIS